MLAPGQVVGAYRITRRIGEGGMGVVYEAEHTRIGRRVAIKFVATHSDREVVRRLYAEGRTINRVHHENIVEVTDLIERGDDSGLVMEYLEGRSLEAELAAHGPLPIPRLLAIASQVAHAMAAAHAAGIVHRDLKPSNIHLCHRGGKRDFVKILDFGAANLEATDCSIEPIIVGTPLYIAPEMSTRGTSDARGDIYSLGVVLYEALTGKPPFNHARVRDILIAHVSQKPAPPSRLAGLAAPIPPPVEKLILWCLEKDPARRPPSMAAVATELDAIAAERERPPQQPLPRLVPRLQALAALTPLRRRSMRPGAALATAATLLLAFAILRWSDESEPPAVPPPPAVIAPAIPVPRAAARPPVHPVPRARLTPAAITPPPPPPADPLPVAADSRPKRERRKPTARRDSEPAPEAVSVTRTPPMVRATTRTVRTSAVTGARPRRSRLIWLAQVTSGPPGG